jgi:hypothetical protein
MKMATHVVTRQEWRWVLVCAVLVMAFTSVPYLMGWRVATATGLTFGGFVLGVEDGNSYLAKMAQGARGEWLFHIVYTSEEHEGAFFFPFHLLLGKAAALLPGAQTSLTLRLIWTYHAARLACGLLLLTVVYRFIARMIGPVPLRRFAWWMVAVGGGLGWLLVAAGRDNWLGSPPLDFILPEGFTFLTLFALPHICLARALMLGGLLLWFEGVGINELDGAVTAGRWRNALAAGLLWLVMGLIVPFYVAVVGAVIVATMVLVVFLARGDARLGRVFLAGMWARSAAAGMIALPVVLYAAWVFLNNPVMRGWSAQNLILSPPAAHYVAAYLVPGILALAGLRRMWRERPGWGHWLLVAWVLVVSVLLYAPFNLQRRLIEGYQLPLYTLAAWGAEGWLSRRNAGWVLKWGLATLMVPTCLMLVAGGVLVVRQPRAPVFHSPAQIALAEWLTEHAHSNALVLSSYPVGNFLPAWSHVRSYWGHGPETIDLARKRENAVRFYLAGEDAGWRANLIESNRIQYVVWGPFEQELTARFDADLPSLELVWQFADWTLYAVGASDG